MRTIQLSVVAAAVSLALAGCGALGPNYERPAQTLPTAAIKPQSTHTSATVDWLAWWKGFQDPTLDALLDEAAPTAPTSPSQRPASRNRGRS